jgi:hypothetical protein
MRRWSDSSQDKEAFAFTTLAQRKEIDVPPPLLGRPARQKTSRVADDPLKSFRRWRQGVSEDVFERIVRRGWPRAATNQSARLGGTETRKLLESLVYEEEAALAIEQEEGIARVLEDSLPAK